MYTFYNFNQLNEAIQLCGKGLRMKDSVLTVETLQERVAAAGEVSGTHKEIAKYVMHHLREVSLMSASRLAATIQVSQASISRFCATMGFSGYADFVHTVQDLVREEWRAPDRLTYVSSDHTAHADTLVSQEIENLERLQQLARDPAIDRVADLIHRAGRLVLTGSRASATLIPYAAYFLSKIRDHVIIATPGTTQWDTIPVTAEPDTAVLAWVFPRYPTATVDWLHAIHRRGLPIAVFTDRLSSPVLDIADVTVVVPVASASLFDSYAAPMVLMNLLVRRVARQSPQIAMRLHALETWDQTHHTYFHSPARSVSHDTSD